MVMTILLVLLLVGCESAVQQKHEESGADKFSREMDAQQAERESREIEHMQTLRNLLERNPYISDENKERIKNGVIYLGMDSMMAVLAMGRTPDDINTSTGSWGDHSQWIWENIGGTIYLYFENGVLTSFSD